MSAWSAVKNLRNGQCSQVVYSLEEQDYGLDARDFAAVVSMDVEDRNAFVAKLSAPSPLPPPARSESPSLDMSPSRDEDEEEKEKKGTKREAEARSGGETKKKAKKKGGRGSSGAAGWAGGLGGGGEGADGSNGGGSEGGESVCIEAIRLFPEAGSTRNGGKHVLQHASSHSHVRRDGHYNGAGVGGGGGEKRGRVHRHKHEEGGGRGGVDTLTDNVVYCY